MRVIDENGKQVGILTVDDAKAMARERNLNLVEVSPEANPPVCKVMDYGKFRYNQRKKEHKAKQKQHQIVVKEIRLRPKIERHDLETKVRHAREFLERGDKVQVNMLFRGPEMRHVELGKKVMESVIELLSDLIKVEKPPTLQGRRMVMILSSK